MADIELVTRRLRGLRVQLAAKRGIDVALAVTLLVLATPLLLLVAVLVKATSRGPVLYSNERVGRDGHGFRCYKFRSMVVDQHRLAAIQAVAQQQAERGVLLKLADDPRVTRLGRWLRKSSIDELPQLWNVLVGDMSFVGPRPTMPFMLAHLPQFGAVRCKVRPGITGLWQIRDRRHNTCVDFMVEHDLEYVRNCSLLLDLQILAATPAAVLKADGAL